MLAWKQIAVTLLVCGGWMCGCAMGDDASRAKKLADNPGALANVMPSKAAATQPSNQNVTGTVTFTQDGADVKVVADIVGLTPGKHGFHIHEKADMSDPQLQSVGPHWNPGGHKHGGLDTPERHAGDLGNLDADSAGKAHADETLKGVKLADIEGRSVIVHAKEDDIKTDPSGNSGGRIAGGAIEIKK